MADPVPAGTELARPFLPTGDFERARQFYEVLGFEKTLDGDVAIFRVGASGFILQRAPGPQEPANLMMQLMVDDLDAWWAHVCSLDLETRFGVTMRAPAMQPWGLRVAFLTDPSGVLWHVAQRRAGVTHDR